MAKTRAPTMTRPPKTPPMIAGVLLGLPSPLVTCCGVGLELGELSDEDDDEDDVVEVSPLPEIL